MRGNKYSQMCLCVLTAFVKVMCELTGANKRYLLINTRPTAVSVSPKCQVCAINGHASKHLVVYFFSKDRLTLGAATPGEQSCTRIHVLANVHSVLKRAQ